MIQQENYFTSKSNVLKFLNSKLKKSKIEKIFDFTVKQWESDKNKILTDIQKKFLNEMLIIRSSAVGEDSIELISYIATVWIYRISLEKKQLLCIRWR